MVNTFLLLALGFYLNPSVGYAEVIFIQPGGKLDTMWRDAWQRLCY